MPYREHLPAVPLRPYIDRYWTFTPEAGAPPVRILPDGCVDVIVTTGAPLLVGAMTGALLVAPDPAAGAMVGVRFRPGGAWPFFRRPLHPLTDGAEPLEEGGETAEGTGDPGACLKRVEGGLLRRLGAASPGRREAGVLWAAERLMRSGGRADLSRLAHGWGVSRRQFERTMKEATGLTPKRLARIARFRRTTALLKAGHGGADTALALGYADQAHMVRDFTSLAGVAPNRWLRETGAAFLQDGGVGSGE